MGSRIDELERSISELMATAGAEEEENAAAAAEAERAAAQLAASSADGDVDQA